MNELVRLELRRKGLNSNGLLFAWAVAMGAIFGAMGHGVIPAVHFLVDPPRPSIMILGPTASLVILLYAVFGIIPGVFGSLVSTPFVQRKLRRKRLGGTAVHLFIWHAACVAGIGALLGVFLESIPGATRALFPALFGASWAITFALLAKKMSDLPTDGFCRTCQYDLTGNVSAVCPECGTPIPVGQSRMTSRTEPNVPT